MVIAELIRAVSEHSRRFHSARRRPLLRRQGPLQRFVHSSSINNVTAPGVCVVAGEEVAHEADRLAVHVPVVLADGVVEVGEAETHQEVLPPELRAQLRPRGPDKGVSCDHRAHAVVTFGSALRCWV